jgi:acyl transferase domain-containing protein
MSPDSNLIAVVGMAGRFPGAANLDEFWRNLSGGVESITRYPARQSGGHTYTPGRGVLDGADRFDAAFFGFTPREATLLDPQHRLLLECAWEALEDAGYDPARCPWPVGVYAGSSQSPYERHVREHLTVDDWAVRLANSMDLLTARVSYKLGLTGPAVTVQTGCSTSLVAIHLAAQALLAGDCEAALAGGVSAVVPNSLMPWSKGSPVSRDGHVRAFDEAGSGFVSGEGVGIVVLRRLEDALRDGDHVHAVVRGSAINNDGAAKVGFTAPGVDGQTEVIRAAQAVAGVSADTVGYVEAHGTGTPLGDPIEVEALTNAFRGTTDARGFCRIGSVKTNIGHADTAAGVAGFIKTVLALRHRKIPPSLHFREPNRKIDFDASPFVVNTTLCDWAPRAGVRRAGISGMGIGGTNAHVVVEEAPTPAAAPSGRPWHLLTVSARSAEALDAAAARVTRALTARDGADLADAAWTLQQSRSTHPYRRFAVCASGAQATTLTAGGSPASAAGRTGTASGEVVHLFADADPGHLPLDELYAHEPAFRSAVDDCAAAAPAGLAVDLRAAVCRPSAGSDPVVAACATFVVQYALAALWRHWGVEPVAVAGHGTGAYTAACVAGVLRPDEALPLVAQRARALGSGSTDDAWVDLADLARRVPARRPGLPWVSDLTGGWVDTRQAVDPAEYWVAQARADSFDAALTTLLEWRALTLLEVGRGTTLADRLAAHSGSARRHTVLASLPGEDHGSTYAAALTTLGRLWAAGLDPHWHRLYEGERRRRAPLPTYPFERRSYLPEPAVPPVPAPVAGPSREPAAPAPVTAAPADTAVPVPAVDTAPVPVETVPAAPADAVPAAAAESGADDAVLTTVRALFVELFGVPEVGADDDFFDLGGDSLLAIELAARINETYELDLPLRSVYGAPVVADLAAAVRAALAADGRAAGDVG